MTQSEVSLADLAGVLIGQRLRLREIADVLNRYGLTRLANRVLEAHPGGDGRGSGKRGVQARRSRDRQLDHR